MDIPIKSLAVGGRIPRVYEVISLTRLLRMKPIYPSENIPKSKNFRRYCYPIPFDRKGLPFAMDLKSCDIVRGIALEKGGKDLFFPLNFSVGLSEDDLLGKIIGKNTLQLRHNEDPHLRSMLESLVIGRLFGLGVSGLDYETTETALGNFEFEEGQVKIFKSRYDKGGNGSGLHEQAIKTLYTLSDVEYSRLYNESEVDGVEEKKISNVVSDAMVSNFNREKESFDALCKSVRDTFVFPLVLDGLYLSGIDILKLNLENTSIKGYAPRSHR